MILNYRPTLYRVDNLLDSEFHPILNSTSNSRVDNLSSQEFNTRIILNSQPIVYRESRSSFYSNFPIRPILYFNYIRSRFIYWNRTT
jgi:hypothetical protein